MQNKEPIDKLIEELSGYEGGPGPTEATKAKILSSCTKGLISAIDHNSKESSKLTKVIIALNIILALATLAIAIIGGTDLYLRIQGINSINRSFSINSEKM